MVLNDLTILACCKTGLGPSLYTCNTFDPVEFHPGQIIWIFGVSNGKAAILIYHRRGKLSYAVFI